MMLRISNGMAVWLAVVLGFSLAPAAGPPPPPVDAFGDRLPRGAVARIGTIRLRHARGVECLAFSPDDKSLISAGHGDPIRVWDAETGELRVSLSAKDADSSVRAIAFSPDGKRIASTGWAGNVAVWDGAGGSTPVIFGTSRIDTQLVVKFTADGKDIHTCDRPLGGPVAVRTWSLKTGTVRHQFSIPANHFFRPSFSADGRLVTACTSDRAVEIWDVGAGKRLLQLPKHKDNVYAAVFSPDGRTLATGGRSNEIHLWEVATGGLVRTLPGKGGNHFAFSPDGRSLVSADYGNELVVWDLRSGKSKRSFEVSRRVDALAFSHDGKTLAAGTGEGVIHLIDFASGKETRPGAGVPTAMVPLAFLAGGSRLAIGWEGGLAVWEIGKPRPGAGVRPVRELRRTETLGKAVAVSRDGNLAVVGRGYDGALLWDVPKRAELRKFEARDTAGAAFTADAKRVALFSRSGTALWDVATGKLVRRFEGRNRLESSGALSPDGALMATADDAGVLHFWDTATGKERSQVSLAAGERPAHEYYRLGFSPDGKLLAVAGHRRRLRLWDVAGRRFVRTLAMMPVFAFSDDGKRLAGVDADDAPGIWDVSTGERIRTLPAKGGDVRFLLFSPDDSLLASSGPGSSVLLWDIR